jgi:hypothetical protein
MLIAKAFAFAMYNFTCLAQESDNQLERGAHAPQLDVAPDDLEHPEAPFDEVLSVTIKDGRRCLCSAAAFDLYRREKQRRAQVRAARR